MKFFRVKDLAAIWLFALLINAFSVAIFAEAPKNSVAGLVYCPLTKKFQPVKAEKKEIRQNPLEEICADERDKKTFSDELYSTNFLYKPRLDVKQFENLVFDFFQKGKSAFAGIPQFPRFPHKDSIKASAAVIVFSKTNETEFVWKSNTEGFSFAQNSRPPNAILANLFEPQNFRKLEKISRRIAPRAPPFSL